MITFEDVQEYRGIKIGDRVSICLDSGFNTDVCSYHVVKAIRLAHYDAESRAKCNENIATHVVYTFTDGQTAGNYDRVKKAQISGTDKLCQLLYNRKAEAKDYLGGSEAKMLLDAAVEIERLRLENKIFKVISEARKVLALADDLGPVELAQNDRVFAQFEFDELREAFKNLDS